MISKALFPNNLTEIDALTRADHHHLTPDDKCYYLGEYNARKGYAYSATNNLIINLKKGMERRGTSEWHHKIKAINIAAAALRRSLADEFLRKGTFVPIPPSKAKEDPLYDPRMTLLLQRIDTANPVDVRELILQTESTEAAHKTDEPRDPLLYKSRYVLDESILIPTPKHIVICDDVLTTGAHFKAVQALLSEACPHIPIFGIFIARRTPETDDFEIFMKKSL